MPRLLSLVVALGCLTTAAPISAADVFDRHTPDILARSVRELEPLESLSMQQSARLKPLSPRSSSPCLVIKTAEGNWAKALVAWGFRKGDKPIPVLIIERYVTYRGDLSGQAIAAGKDLVLFAGLGFDFDLGQVVPVGQGEEITLTADAVLTPQADAAMYVLPGSALPATPDAVRPADRDGVLPQDFAGTWKVNADGRWRGEWELTVDERGRISGKHTSDDTKSAYDISGSTAALPHNAHLIIHLANAEQNVDAYLWTTDKSAMAGTVTLAGRTFGFFAVRQGD